MTDDNRAQIGDLIRASWDKDDPTGWFDEVYKRGKDGQGIVPWAHMQPTPDLVDWLNKNNVNGTGQSALVIGCGLGDDAIELEGRGFDVTAFDVSPEAIKWCAERFPQSKVDFQVADLLNPPTEWHGKFDFVLENRTIQALPYQLHQTVIANIASFVSNTGTLLVMCHARAPEEEARGIPWPLSRVELALFVQNGLIEANFRDYSKNGLRRFIVEYRSEHD